MADEKQMAEQEVKLSRRRLRQTAADVEALSDEAAVAGLESLDEGLETLAEAEDVALAGREALAAGASDVTRGVTPWRSPTGCVP